MVEFLIKNILYYIFPSFFKDLLKQTKYVKFATSDTLKRVLVYGQCDILFVVFEMEIELSLSSKHNFRELKRVARICLSHAEANPYGLVLSSLADVDHQGNGHFPLSQGD